MNIQHRVSNIMLCSMTVAILVVGTFGTSSAIAKGKPGPKVEVLSATPDTAVQGAMEDIVIGGNGFDAGSRVRFLVSGTNDASQIDVQGVVYNSADGTLTASILVDGEALAVDYDIEVQASSGRKGKGTTLFSVQLKKTVYTCDEALPAVGPRSCTCTFTRREQINEGAPPVINWDMQANCSTDGTLVVGQYEELTGANFKLTALAPFNGSSVISSKGHRARVTNLWVEIGPSVDAGCEVGQLRSAIGFVLDENSADPRDPAGFESGTYPSTLLEIKESTISSLGAPLCHAIEARRTPEYSTRWPPATNDGMANVARNVIIAGSYSRTGVLLSGFTPSGQTVWPIVVTGNTIGAAASANANAIQFGPLLGFEAGTVEDNVITVNDGTGILLSDSPGGTWETTIDVSRNNIMGAAVGILVDSGVAGATIKLNILEGASGDIAVCTEEPAGTSLRGNKFNGYDSQDKVVELACGSNPSQ